MEPLGKQKYREDVAAAIWSTALRAEYDFRTLQNARGCTKLPTLREPLAAYRREREHFESSFGDQRERTNKVRAVARDWFEALPR